MPHRYPSENQLLWLNRLLHERLSDDIYLTLKTLNGISYVRLHFAASEKTIDICVGEQYYQPGEPKYPSAYTLPLPYNHSHSLPFRHLVVPNALPSNSPQIPLIYTSNGIVLNIDLLGICYWQMNRLEEYYRSEDCYDIHGRFVFSKSLACGSYIDIPIADHCIAYVSFMMALVWPSYTKKQHKFSLHLSHDVDRIGLLKSTTYKGHLKYVFANLRRHKYLPILQQVLSLLLPNSYLSPHDPFNTFDDLASISRHHNIQSQFLFIASRGSAKYEAGYALNMPYVQTLMKHILASGHYIGLHPSYNAATDSALLRKEVSNLISNLNPYTNLTPSKLFSRFHYLRWSWPNTLQILADAGISYDSTLTYAENAGFRCGTCHPYNIYDHANDRPSQVLELPLIAMDKTLTSERYSSGSYLERLSYAQKLKTRCLEVAGTFTVLWHNGNLSDPQNRSFYLSMLNSGNG